MSRPVSRVPKKNTTRFTVRIVEFMRPWMPSGATDCRYEMSFVSSMPIARQ